MEVLKIFSKIKSPEFWDMVEFNRYGILFNIVIFQSCLASISVGFVCKNLDHEAQTIPLILLSVSALAANGANIAQSPMKWILGLIGSTRLSKTSGRRIVVVIIAAVVVSTIFIIITTATNIFFR